MALEQAQGPLSIASTRKTDDRAVEDDGHDSRPSKRNRTAENKPTIALEDYSVGWVCALPLEMAAAKGMLDDIHPDLAQQDPADHNSYILGRVQAHNVVIACLPAGIHGTTTAATVAKDLLRTFKSIRFGLMVGIGGGVPSRSQDIRLGDIVVSQPNGTNGGLIQYDRGKTVQGGHFQRTGSLNAPPQSLLAALSRLQANHLTEESRIPQFLTEFVTKIPPRTKKKFSYQGVSNDCLYLADYDHSDPDLSCDQCDQAQTVSRSQRDDTDPVIHYGTIVSGNQVMKHAKTRDNLSKELGAMCLEMEAAGLQDFPCLVIRGISDYADSHKNNIWQGYAAATAAAFAKELLSVVTPDRVLRETPIANLETIANEQLQVARQHVNLTSENLAEHRRTNEILEDCPIDLRIVHEARHDSADVADSPRCEAGTRVRIQQAIAGWADEDSKPCFWLVGPAGTGKSTLARTVADTFLKEGRLAAGYFFKRGEKGRNDTSRLFSTLAVQIADTIPSFKRCLQTSLKASDSEEIEKKSLEVQFEKLLLLPLGNLPPVSGHNQTRLIIIDALDECERLEHLPRIMNLLRKLCNIQTIRLRLLFTSRAAPSLDEAFQPLVEDHIVQSLKLHQEFTEDTKTDIRTYLSTRFEDIRRKRKVQQDPWPPTEDLDRLIELATNPEPLFIYAATLCRFVYDEQKRRNPKTLLKLWLRQCEDNKSQLHQIYDPIISQVFLSNEEVESHQLLQFLVALAILATPLSAMSLGALLDADVDDVSWWLAELHAVLDVPAEPHRPLRLLHKSFSDYLLTQEDFESGKHRVDSADIHGLLVTKCIQRMSAMLKQDICDIRELDATPDMTSKEARDRHIPDDLKYACLYWVYHLEVSEQPPGNRIYTFLLEHFLHWLEVLSLLGHISNGVQAVRILFSLLKRWRNSASDFIEFTHDATRVVSKFASIIEHAPLQTYAALLLFSPGASKVRQNFWHQRLPRLCHIQGTKMNWDAHLQTFEGHSDSITNLEFSPDGELLASSSSGDNTVRLWNATTGTCLMALFANNYIRFSPDSQLLAFTSHNDLLEFLNTRNGTRHCIRKVDVIPILQPTFTPDSQFLATVSYSRKRGNIVQLWEAKTGDLHKTIVLPKKGLNESLEALSPNMQTSAWRLCRDRFHLCNLTSGTTQAILEGHGNTFVSITFSPDSQFVVSTSLDRSIRLWNAATGAQRLILDQHGKDLLEAEAFSSDSQFLAFLTKQNEGSVQILSLATGIFKSMFVGYETHAVALSSDGQTLAAADKNMIKLWDVSSHINIEYNRHLGRLELVASRDTEGLWTPALPAYILIRQHAFGVCVI
ncbi:Vegetative incompatibility protein [Paramyrothecium foliicola]|nr:Vegetative incompatibility protein [Paramyrothecium foliicola]